MFRTIRWRIAIPYIALIIMVMLGVSIYISLYIRQSYMTGLKEQLTTQAYLISDTLSKRFDPNSIQQDLDPDARAWADMIGSQVTVIAVDGTVIGESHADRAMMGNQSDRPEIIDALNTGFGTSTRFSQTNGFNTYYIGVPVVANGQTVAVIRVARPLEEIQSAITHLQRAILGAAVLAAGVAVIIAFLIANRTTRPIQQLTESATKFSQGDLEGRLLPPSEDEVGQLTQAFNLMATRMRSLISSLDKEQREMSTVLKEMTDGVVIVDVNGYVSMINPAAEAMFQVGQDKAIGGTLAESLRNHQLVELWQYCYETNETQSALIEINTSRLYLQCVATPLSDSTPGDTLLLLQNLTRQRYLETIRRDFISNISHELRTPLASLKALTETLQEGALEDPPAARRFLQRMEAEVDALSQMISELLELSRIESGRVPIQMQSILPVQVISKAVDRLRLQAERAHLQLIIDCPQDLPMILADPPRLEQVMVNLLHNSIKFTPPGGKIFVRTREVEQSELPISNDGDQIDLNRLVILFSVEDTGVGIPSEDVSRIFERFYKADRARSSGGTGLGLAIARHTIEAHGGKIWVESVESRGSTFKFFLPLAS